MSNSQKTIRAVLDLLNQGLTVDEISSKLGIPRDQVDDVKYIFGEDVTLQDIKNFYSINNNH